MNDYVDTQEKMNSLMSSNNGVWIMEDPYSERDGDDGKNLKTWI